MRISLKVIIYLMTAIVRLLSVTGQEEDGDNIPAEKMKCYSAVFIDSNQCNGYNLFSCVIQEKDEGGNVTECKFCISDDGKDPDDSGCSCESAQPEIHLCVASVKLLSGGSVNICYGDKSKVDKMKCYSPVIIDSNQCNGNNLFSCAIQEKDEGGRVIECKFYISDDGKGPDDSGCSCESAQPEIHLCVAEENIKSDLPTLQKTTTLTPTVKTAEKVTETTETDSPQLNTATSENHSGDPLNKGVIPAAVVCPALLLILVLVLILCRHRLPRTQVCCAAGGSSEQRTNAEHNTKGNQGDHHYEEIQMRNQQASSGDALPSVYATVNLPVDELHYPGIKFQEKSIIVSTDGNALPEANKNGSSACVNSSISSSQGDTHPPAAQQTLYSTVTIAKPGKA